MSPPPCNILYLLPRPGPRFSYQNRYQYHGSDLSLLYKYILSPLAERGLVLVPSWMAPNLVTTIGLGLTTASYVLMYYTAPGLVSAETPTWVFLTAALGVFLYQTLDNMDGKQVTFDFLVKVSCAFTL